MRQIKPIPGSLPLFAPPSNWKAPNLSDLPRWKNAKLTAFDTEFDDPTLRTLGIGARRGAKLVGYSFCLDGDRPYYIPLRHPGPGNVDVDHGLNYLRDNLGHDFSGILVGANLNIDLDIVHYENVRPDFDKVKCKDIQVRGPLIYEFHFKYSLEAEAARWGYEGKDETLLKEFAQSYGYDIKSAGWKSCIPKLPAHAVGPYGENDAGILIPVYKAQQKVIDEQGLNEVDDLESRLLPFLLKMRQRGLRIDFDHLDKVEAWALQEEIDAISEVKRLTGWDIGIGNCMAAGKVAPALIAIGFTPDRTENGLYSVKSETLDYILSVTDKESTAHKVAKAIRHLRQVNKLRTTFVASVRRYQTNGRIHSTFRQIVGVSENNEKSGAAYGRLSSAHLNIQQQPSRGKFANFWRQIYLPEEGAEFLSCDYSAVEPRWQCHFSEILKLTGAQALGDMYRTNPRLDPHQATADLTGLSRKDSKPVGLGLTYRMGSLKLAKQALKMATRFLVQIGRNKHYFTDRKAALDFRIAYKGTDKIRMDEVAGEEAQAILDKFHAGVPFIRELAAKAEDKAKASGVLKLLGGRHLHFPLDEKGNEYLHTYKSVSKLIQGTAAYQMKLALLALDKECPEALIAAQIHDEIWASIFDRRVAKKVSEIMINAVKARVPFRCDAEVGPNLGQLQLLCMEKDCIDFIDPTDKFACPKHALKAV